MNHGDIDIRVASYGFPAPLWGCLYKTLLVYLPADFWYTLGQMTQCNNPQPVL